MLTLVLGKNDSGKSEYAERLVAQLDIPDRYYVATMIPYGEDGARRVEKHLKMRSGLGMTTLEDPYLDKITDVIKGGELCLIEDMSNLIANYMFERPPYNEKELLKKIEILSNTVKEVIVVSISGIDESERNSETSAYMDALAHMNQELSLIADEVFEMIDGRPVRQRRL